MDVQYIAMAGRRGLGRDAHQRPTNKDATKPINRPASIPAMTRSKVDATWRSAHRGGARRGCGGAHVHLGRVHPTRVGSCCRRGGTRRGVLGTNYVGVRNLWSSLIPGPFPALLLLHITEKHQEGVSMWGRCLRFSRPNLTPRRNPRGTCCRGEGENRTRNG
jgi:hypothetical protein